MVRQKDEKKAMRKDEITKKATQKKNEKTK